jgi:type IVB pilus formation R64 PilN family outer membrane protein
MDRQASLALALTLSLLTACAPATTSTLSEDKKAQILAEEVARLAQQQAPPAAAAKKRAEPAEEPPPPPDPLERRVSLSAVGMPLHLLLSRLADQAGLRLVTEREAALDVPVNATFQQLPIREALASVLMPKGLSSRVDGPSLVVYTFETRGWTISLPVVQLATSTAITNSTGGSDSMSAVAGVNGSVTTAAGSTFSGARAEVTSRIASISTWAGLETALKAMVSQDAMLTINPALGLITVRDRPDRLAEIDHFLARFEAEAAQQIVVEVRAFEVTLSESDTYGIDWSRVWKNLMGTTSLGVAASFATPLTLPVGISLVEPNGVNVLVRALSTQGKVKVLSQPSIRLLNGHPAVMQAGRVRSFIAEASQTISGSGGLSTSTVKLGSVQDGVILPLTARIVQDEIVLNLAPILSQVRDIRTVTSGQTTVEAPDVDNRSVQTTVRLRSGETVILGGLISAQERDDKQGLPLLLKVPVLGWLSGFRDRSAVRTEVVLTLTPTLVPRTTRPSKS